MQKINKAIEVLRQGGIIIFPTDTAYGIGCRMDNAESVEKLFKIRRRPQSQAVPVLVNGKDMAKKYFKDLPKEIEGLMDKFWPGGLTIVYFCKEGKIPQLVRGGKNTIGLRMPNHVSTLSLINGLGVPILGPSANFHGDRTPFTKDEIDPKLLKLVDYFLDDEALGKDLLSTVVDCTKKPWQILRQGVVQIYE